METICMKNVHKEIKKNVVLKDLSLSLESGRIYGLHGRNGSGKTMLLRMIAGLIKPTDGYVYINDKQLHKDIDFPESIGVIIEKPEFWNYFTGFEVLKALSEIKRLITDEDIRNSMLRIGLDPDDKRTVKKYSLGMKQRLGIAQAIMESPKILLLDEPTSALDKSGVAEFKKIISEEICEDVVIVIASHLMEELDLCDTLIEIENGTIVGGF